MTQAVSLTFLRFDRAFGRAWAFAMMGLARPFMARVPDIGFWKLCGSGTGEGFTPVPNTAVYAILATWPSLEIAKTRIASDPTYQKYRTKADESWTVFLRSTQVRGNWAGTEPFEASAEFPEAQLAALTRATIKPGILTRF